MVEMGLKNVVDSWIAIGLFTLPVDIAAIDWLYRENLELKLLNQ